MVDIYLFVLLEYNVVLYLIWPKVHKFVDHDARHANLKANEVAGYYKDSKCSVDILEMFPLLTNHFQNVIENDKLYRN